jgi:undecaprenyl-diphosphatase
VYSDPARIEIRLRYALAIMAVFWLTGLVAWGVWGDRTLGVWLAAPPFNTDGYALFRALSKGGMYGFYLLFLTTWAVGWRTGNRYLQRLGLAYVAAQVLGSLLLVHLFKFACGRPRPGVDDTHMALCPGAGFGHAYSAFPSGHATDLVVSALFVAMFVRARWAGVVAGLVALGVAVSRVVLGSHHVSDVLAGSLLGVGITLASVTLMFGGRTRARLATANLR